MTERMMGRNGGMKLEVEGKRKGGRGGRGKKEGKFCWLVLRIYTSICISRPE